MISIQNLFDAYYHWCFENGIHDKIDKRQFLKALREGLTKSHIPYTEAHSGVIRYFKGIHLSLHMQKALDDDIIYRDDDFAEEDVTPIKYDDCEDDNEAAYE